MTSLYKKIFSSLLLLIVVAAVNAQSPADLKAQMVKDWERAKAYTQDYLTAMPADKYSFKATDSVKSFAQQMLHIASANAFFVSTALSGTSIFGERDIENSATAQTKDSVVSYVNASYDAAIAAIKNADAAKLSESVKAFGMEQPGWVWLLKAFEHQTHHRGQTTIYLRLAGVKPPGERLF